MRVLIVRLSHLGDVVLALPLFHALRAAHADAEIGWAVQPEFAGLLDGLPGLERTFAFERRRGPGAWWRLRRELRAWRPDWSVDAQGNAKSAAVALVSGARRRTGLARLDWRERIASSTLHDAAAPARGPHAMDRVAALVDHVAPMAPTPSGSRLRTDPGLTATERERGRALLREHVPPGTAGRILHLAPPGDVKAWPQESFGALARLLVDAGERVLVLSGPAEAAAGARLAAELPAHPRLAHWSDQRGLRPLAALLSAAAEEGMRLVGCDSGPAHLAAACGMGVDLLSGPQDPARTGPWSDGAPRHTALVRDDPPSCQPCRSRRCAHPQGPVCLLGLEPQQVAERLLAGARGASAAPRPQ